MLDLPNPSVERKEKGLTVSRESFCSVFFFGQKNRES